MRFRRLLPAVDNNVENIQLRYLGWREGGLIPGAPNRVRLGEEIRSEDEFKELVKFLEDTGVGFYPDVDFLNLYNTKYYRLDLKRDVAQSLNRQPVWLIRDNLFTAYVTAPALVDTLINKFMTDYQKYNIGGLALGDLGTQINSDHNVDRTVSRADSMVINQNAMKRLKEERGLELMITAPMSCCALCQPYYQYSTDSQQLQYCWTQHSVLPNGAARLCQLRRYTFKPRC